MFVQYLGGREVEILLRHVHAAFAQSVHAGFGAHSLQLRAGTAVHLLGDFGQVDSSRQVHAAAMDAENICARFDSVCSRERGGVKLLLGLGGGLFNCRGIRKGLTLEEEIQSFDLCGLDGGERGRGCQVGWWP